MYTGASRIANVEVLRSARVMLSKGNTRIRTQWEQSVALSALALF